MGIFPKVYADSVVVDKIYHPYVLPNETEIEWRFFSQQRDNKNQLVQRLGYGFSLSENVMVEGYLVGERDLNGNYGLQSYELELRWMVTEQGKYWMDVGTLFELEKKYNRDDWGATSGILLEKEFGRTSLTMNFFMINEWGVDIKNEMETEFRFQYRYRWIPQLQPAIEFYSGPDYVGIGPAFMGLQRFDRQKQLKWEVGFIFGVNGDSQDQALRLDFEYEF